MKRVRYLVLLLILIPVVYLYYSYIRIYNIIGNADLKSPYLENRVVLTNPQNSGSVKYVALGDSLGAGVGSDSIETTYPYQYAGKLLEQYGTVEMVVLAYPGDKTVEVTEGQLEQAISEDPDYVTLMIGTNDIHNHVTENKFRSNFKTILEVLIQGTSAKLVVINLPYLGAGELVQVPFNLALDYKTRRFNEIIKEVSLDPRIKVVDLYTPLTKEVKSLDGYYASDYFHPSGRGYLLWSKYINED